MMRIQLTRKPLFKSLLTGRWTQLLLRALMLAGLVFTILAGLLGTPVGSHNFAIIVVWIAWWTALKLIFIPFGGRSWCSICPIPLPGEWLQRGGITRTVARRFGLNLRLHRWLRGTWLQSGGFLLVGLFGAVTLTSASITAWVLLSALALATALSPVFERRAFCNALCPIGGFTGLYARLAPVELRVIDRPTCIAHRQKSCYDACPWGVYPFALKHNGPCGLCMECVRACPYDNLAINLRPFGADMQPRNPLRIDEVFLALVMLGSVLLFSAIFLGPWGDLKAAAYAIGQTEWFLLSGAFLAFLLVLFPAIFLFAVRLSAGRSSKSIPLKTLLGKQAQLLLPVGLTSWVAFTISFALAKSSYVLPVLSDPFGWGWRLLGNVQDASASLERAALTQLLIALVICTGLFWTGRIARQQGALRGSLPVLLFCLLFSFVLLWLLVG